MKIRKAHSTTLLSLFLALGCAEERNSTDSFGEPLSDVVQKIVTSNTDNDESQNLIVRIKVQDKEVIEFYEPREGTLVVSGAGAPDGPSPASGLDWSPSEFASSWSKLFPDKEMPARLRDALQRIGADEETDDDDDDDGKVRHEVSEPEIDAGGLASAPSGVKKAHHNGGSGYCHNGYWDFNNANSRYVANAYTDRGAHDVNRWHEWDHITGTTWVRNTETALMATSVCPYRNSVRLQVTAGNPINGGSWNVPEHTVRWWWGIDRGCYSGAFDDCPTVESRVRNASGDGYHFIVGVQEECSAPFGIDCPWSEP